MSNPDASWRDGHEGAATPEQFAAARRVLRSRPTSDRWARHDRENAEAEDERRDVWNGGNR